MPAADNRPRSSIYLTYDQITVLRNLAEDMGFYQTRGAGTGRVGSVSALLGQFAWVATNNPGGVAKFLRDEIERNRRLDEKYGSPVHEDRRLDRGNDDLE